MVLLIDRVVEECRTERFQGWPMVARWQVGELARRDRLAMAYCLPGDRPTLTIA